MFPSATPRRVLLLVVCAAVAGGAAHASTPPGSHDGPALDWRLLARPSAGDAPTALATDGARLAIGGVRGVRELSSLVDGVPETVLRRGPVADLAFLQDGRLLVATTQGVYRVDRDGRALRETLPQGSGPVARLDAAGGVAVAATREGVFLRGLDAVWRRVHALPRADASLVALRSQREALELWCVIGGGLWIAGLHPEASEPWRLTKRWPLPVARADEGAVDVAFDLPGTSGPVLAFPTTLAVREPAGGWRGLRPALPPGARIRRIAHAFGRLWLATDAGLLSASRLEGPWERAASPVGSLPVIGLRGGSRLAAATHRGIHVAEPLVGAAQDLVGHDANALQGGSVHDTHALQGGSVQDVHALQGGLVHDTHAARLLHAREEPAVGVLHAAALRRQGLEASRLRMLRERVSRRGWLPELELAVGYENEQDRRWDFDESFVSGATRRLQDRQRDRARGLDVTLSLSWDLGDTIFDPEEIDLSREARAVIALRDDVLDEVTQLYFERLRVLARLEASPDPGERAQLVLRAAELAAGLDAWTGGAFNAARP